MQILLAASLLLLLGFAVPCLAFAPVPPPWERRGLARMSATQSPAELRLEEARKILTSFPAKDYIAPLWARNQHVNTIAGALFVTPPKPDYVRQVYFVFLPLFVTPFSHERKSTHKRESKS